MKARNFILCGLTGWCIEVAFTSLCSAGKHDRKLIGQTSAWMFPIYGMASLIDDVYPKIQNRSPLRRGLLYGVSIMAVEYASGRILTRLNLCPWSYKGCKYAIKDVVRLDFLPLWMGAGLLYERLLRETHKT